MSFLQKLFCPGLLRKIRELQKENNTLETKNRKLRKDNSNLEQIIQETYRGKVL